ncbi:hypothetical protein KSC_071760 [Ktedonobacter sp. SOSP1-52]|uniref:hypothetical protein n=1 Tax=Ktedonobacter sp. SOSP1-52 TaxID=2778366 RepID=UPI001916C523|nr:hypothetical protein [Ktedonobacter sp. SOSP1-52]GHO68284.1 hypothetical protein KSC_071760 [Ktedonobacter sp. SOSP1-52]
MAHAHAAEQGIWVLNEKRLLQRAGLSQTEEILANIGKGPKELMQAVGRMRQILGLARPEGMKADEVVKPKA